MTDREWAYERPDLYQYQLDAVFHERRWGLVEACTKSGKTTACLIWIFEQALAGPPGATYWWVAPVADQSKFAFGRFKQAVDQSLYDASETDLAISLHNGTTIQFRSGDRPDSLYGEDVYAAVLDEASRMMEDAWHAVRSTLTATGGPALLDRAEKHAKQVGVLERWPEGLRTGWVEGAQSLRDDIRRQRHPRPSMSIYLPSSISGWLDPE